MVVCGDEVVVAATRNAVATDDVAAAVGFTAAIGATTAVVVWVQRCYMRAYTSL